MGKEAFVKQAAPNASGNVPDAAGAKSDSRKISRISQEQKFSNDPLCGAFKTIKDAIWIKGKTTADNMAAASRSLDELLPELAKAQAFLSKRGDERRKMTKLGLPTWTEFYATVEKEFKIGYTLRSIQMKLRAMRGAAQKRNGNTQKEPTLNKAAKIAVCKAAVIGSEMVTAIEQGGDPTPFVKEFRSVMNAKRLDDVQAALEGKALTEELEVSEVEKLATRLAEAVRAKDWEQANRLALAILGDAVTEAKPNGGTGKASVNVNVINDKAAEYVMTRIAKGQSVDEKILAQYEQWLSTKGDTERANALRRELAEWKSEIAAPTTPISEQQAVT